MLVQPTVELGKRFSKQRLASLIENTPELRALVSESKERDTGNTILSKDFPGGTLVVTGANSAVGLRSMPARYLLMDECDAYPSTAAGAAGLPNHSGDVEVIAAQVRQKQHGRLLPSWAAWTSTGSPHQTEIYVR